ncbi:hypothetical protein GCM10011515_17970 [Tsuneonella deserti]|uniref:Cysteine-rich CPCC domain-containing protein n=1 Tax=Tsuneonella deserti TaxID=2035528 RepID=A0ABQ1SAF7_9SPHN|nr:hypothetical protein GCM10011515_17970 [Tsuneonella deserti]
MAKGFVCPVCGYNDPACPPYADKQDEWYQEICPSCGTQFGYGDASLSHEELRRRWLASGANWWSPNPPPSTFDGMKELRQAGLLD